MARNMQKSLLEIKIIARVQLVCFNFVGTVIFINKTVKISNRLVKVCILHLLTTDMKN
jgi:hypothetical protein